MAMPRFDGSTSLTRLPPIAISPAVDVLEPGDHPAAASTCRSRTGRRRRRTRRRLMSMLAPWTTSKAPKRLTTLLSVTVAMLPLT